MLEQFSTGNCMVPSVFAQSVPASCRTEQNRMHGVPHDPVYVYQMFITYRRPGTRLATTSSDPHLHTRYGGSRALRIHTLIHTYSVVRHRCPGIQLQWHSAPRRHLISSHTCLTQLPHSFGFRCSKKHMHRSRIPMYRVSAATCPCSCGHPQVRP